MGGVDFIQMKWLDTIDWYGLALGLGKILFAVGVVAALFYFLILRPMKFKHPIIIKDITGGGIVIYKDRGFYRQDKITKSGEFILMKDKKAVLMFPPKSAGMLDKKGKVVYEFIKYGDSPFDYAALDNTQLVDYLNEGKLPAAVPLSNQDWCKLSIKKAAEKRTIGDWWAENRGSVVFITCLVLSLIMVMGSVKMIQESTASVTGSAMTSAEKLQNIADSLDRVAGRFDRLPFEQTDAPS